MREYRLVSADGHVNEPPDIWIDRVPARFRDRAPHMEHFEEGDGWIFEGWDGPINFGFNAAAGSPPERMRPWIRWEDVAPHTYDPAARVQALDEGGLDAELLYATPRISGALLAGTADPELHLACIRAYNDWLSELCGHEPDRLMGLALMPAIGSDAAVAELQRAMQLPGMRAPVIGRWPSGQSALQADDDRFWAAAREMDVPVSVHVAIATGQRNDGDPNRARIGTRGEFRGLGGDTAVNCLELINSGVFDRFPDLHVVFAECESGWVPCARQTFDDRFNRYPPGMRADIAHPPGYYFDNNISTTFVIDRYAIINRHLVGLTQMMWSNDAFHAVCEWPNDLAVIERDFADVPEDERQLILCGNAVRTYRLDRAA